MPVCVSYDVMMELEDEIVASTRGSRLSLDDKQKDDLAAIIREVFRTRTMMFRRKLAPAMTNPVSANEIIDLEEEALAETPNLDNDQKRKLVRVIDELRKNRKVLGTKTA